MIAHIIVVCTNTMYDEIADLCEAERTAPFDGDPAHDAAEAKLRMQTPRQHGPIGNRRRVADQAPFLIPRLLNFLYGAFRVRIFAA